MRTLIVLGVIQTSLLLMLVAKLLIPNDNVPLAGGTDLNVAAADPFEVPPDVHLADDDNYLDPVALRAIIREELAAHFVIGSEPAGLADTAIDSQPKNKPANPYQRDLVEQQLDYYASIGQITQKQMEELQSQIAQLDKDSRQEMLRKLVQAMNSGSIDGRL